MPSSGAANDNGSANWDADFKKMLNALVGHLGSAVPLSDLELAEARTLAAALKNGTDPAEMVIFRKKPSPYVRCVKVLTGSSISSPV
ncbi:hypothetical protein [Pseudomonas sp. MPC6]|uniref:hypothetical protein n=1 Tax=unclassified Pseudomonas TaxID=196821 RepID=UPI0011105F50|nr:hypothetical protein [Pseudomonas sp. MPC6]QCY13352.1 hypothetical protein ELQ88_22715 [Pseudomonas sp. MPC6]